MHASVVSLYKRYRAVLDIFTSRKSLTIAKTVRAFIEAMVVYSVRTEH